MGKFVESRQLQNEHTIKSKVATDCDTTQIPQSQSLIQTGLQ